MARPETGRGDEKPCLQPKNHCLPIYYAVCLLFNHIKFGHLSDFMNASRFHRNFPLNPVAPLRQFTLPRPSLQVAQNLLSQGWSGRAVRFRHSGDLFP
jgi:hypothetical protein